MDSTLDALYEVISGEKDEERNWELFQYLFKPEAKLIPTGDDKNGIIETRYMSVEEYIKIANDFLKQGFYEVEINREVNSFGNIAQVFSTYKSFKSVNDTKPFMRGINSIQMLNDGKRWWVVNIYWMQESDKYPIPKQYLPH
ncbi:hypothetical protein [Ulvibacter antarcticus]|nr:hypothetical protein [Ulvibacter antarcticus]